MLGERNSGESTTHPGPVKPQTCSGYPCWLLAPLEQVTIRRYIYMKSKITCNKILQADLSKVVSGTVRYTHCVGDILHILIFGTLTLVTCLCVWVKCLANLSQQVDTFFLRRQQSLSLISYCGSLLFILFMYPRVAQSMRNSLPHLLLFLPQQQHQLSDCRQYPSTEPIPAMLRILH